MLTHFRKLIKKYHPEGIPFPGTRIYQALSQSTIFQQHYEIIAADIIQYCKAGRLLDIGTGPGWLLLKLHQRSPALKLSGLDLSSSMVSLAVKNMARYGVSDRIEIRQGNAACLPYPAESFETVVSTGAMHHWKRPLAGLNEIHRVLKPGGCTLIYDLVSDTPLDLLKKASTEFGRLRILLLWLHAFEEPFYRFEDLDRLASRSFFGKGVSRFVGITACLQMIKN